MSNKSVEELEADNKKLCKLIVQILRVTPYYVRDWMNITLRDEEGHGLYEQLNALDIHFITKQ